MPLIFRKVSLPSFWALHADVLSFCKVEHATGLQKVAFPSFWALEAPVALHSRTGHWSSESGVSIFSGDRSRSRRIGASFFYVTRCESKPCASSVHSLVPRQELQTSLHCTPASCIYSKRDANAVKYLRYQRRRKKVPPGCRGRCLKGCEQSWHETHATQNPGIHEQSYSKHAAAKSVSNFLCFTVGVPAAQQPATSQCH